SLLPDSRPVHRLAALRGACATEGDKGRTETPALSHSRRHIVTTGGDRGREGFRLPSLRTVRAVFPHTALQSGVSFIETVSPTARPCVERTARLPRRRPLASADDRLCSFPCATTASLVCGEGRVAAGG